MLVTKYTFTVSLLPKVSIISAVCSLDPDFNDDNHLRIMQNCSVQVQKTWEDDGIICKSEELCNWEQTNWYIQPRWFFNEKSTIKSSMTEEYESLTSTTGSPSTLRLIRRSKSSFPFKSCLAYTEFPIRKQYCYI